MFAQLFGAAKRAIRRTPSHTGPSSEAREEVPDVPTSDPPPTDTENTDTAAMVTTRRGTETPGMGATPASAAKKAAGKRELETLDTPTRTKRQRKTTVELTRTLRSTPRKGDDAHEEAVDDTADATPRPGNASPLAIRRRSSPKVVVEPDGFHTPEPESPEAAFVTPFTSKKALDGSPQPAQSATPAAAKKARGRPKKTPTADVPDEIPSSTQESAVASPAVALPTAHVRFGSEEPSVNAKGHTRYEAPAPAPAPAADDEDSADDSDEAPEVVSTSAAASKAAAAQADTSRALAAQSAKELKKREARAARLAEEQAAKRLRDAQKAQKLALKAKKAARLAAVAEEPEPTTDNIPRTTLPSLLPASLLANLDATRPPTPPPEPRARTDEQLRREKLNHHIKFLEHASKPLKDRRVGKHHVAVLAQTSAVLPPKVSRNTKGVREAWLKGRQGTKAKGKAGLGKTGRAKFGAGGFLRGDD